jgi:hypothetical protein
VSLMGLIWGDLKFVIICPICDSAHPLISQSSIAFSVIAETVEELNANIPIWDCYERACPSPDTLMDGAVIDVRIDAIRVTPEALKLLYRSVGPNHPDTLTSDNLAILYSLSNPLKHDTAAALHQRAFAGCERVMGSNHPSTLTSASNFAIWYSEQSKYDEAAMLCRRAFDGRKDKLGPTTQSPSHLPTTLPACSANEERNSGLTTHPHSNRSTTSHPFAIAWASTMSRQHVCRTVNEALRANSDGMPYQYCCPLIINNDCSSIPSADLPTSIPTSSPPLNACVILCGTLRHIATTHRCRSSEN